jgi:hypothetical protein
MPELLGNRIFVEMPKQEESKLVVDENTKEALQMEMLKKMSKVKVHSVGTTVVGIAAGDTILVEPFALSKAVLIPLSDTETVLLVSPFDVILKW